MVVITNVSDTIPLHPPWLSSLSRRQANLRLITPEQMRRNPAWKLPENHLRAYIPDKTGARRGFFHLCCDGTSALLSWGEEQKGRVGPTLLSPFEAPEIPQETRKQRLAEMRLMMITPR